MPRFSRLEIFLFLATFFAFAYFNQGGGWNQNSRFAEVRAMAEQGRFAIDDYFVYQRDPEKDELVRLPVRNSEYEFDGTRYRLAWVDGAYNFITVNPDAQGEDAPMIEVACSGDVGYVPATGHFHPNKPPGTSFLALPAYWIIFQVERLLGIHPDHWRVMTVNVWLTTMFSVGLLTALGCVLFFRLAREFAGGAELPAVLATLALAFGTTLFPFATILFDHALTASLLVATLYFIRRSWREETPSATAGKWVSPRVGSYVVAGMCGGLAVLTNYIAVAAVGALGVYALLAQGWLHKPREWNWRGALAFCAGGVPFAILLGWYHAVNFGSPFTISNDFQNPVFKDPEGSLGMFALPNPYVGQLLLVSPYRGIFWLCPILILGVGGLFVWLREKTWVAEARLSLAIAATFFLVNMSFNGYHAGFSAGPRYLVPAMPFLALGLVVAFVRWRAVAAGLLAVSIGYQFLLTVTDAQNPLAVGGHARLPDSHRKDDFFCNLVTEYAAPLFFQGRCEALLAQLVDATVDIERDRLEVLIDDPEEIARQAEAKRAELEAGIARGETRPFLLAAIRGPVSVNPVGVYDGLLGFGQFDIHSRQAQWASFNAGEFLFPQSRWSVLPLLLVSGTLSVLAVRRACRAA